MTRIDIFSGFLGAGKTTLIKKLIKEAYQGEKLVLIENEFGDIGIHGGFLQESGIEITEMNSGCICCSLVGDFGRALSQVITDFAPERILIEPSGVGKLSDVVAAVKRVESDNVQLGSFTTVVDATSCDIYLSSFGEFYENQIDTASCIVLSRTDELSDEEIEDVVALIRQHNAAAPMITTAWDQLTGIQMKEAIEGTQTLAQELAHLQEHTHHHHHHHDDEDCCCHEHHEHHHHHDHEECDDPDCCCHDHHHDHHHDHCHEEEHCCDHHEHHEHCHHGHDEEECHHHHAHHHDHDHHEEHHHHHDHECDDPDCGCHEHHHHHDHEECDDPDCSCHHHHHHGHHHADEVFTSWGRETTKKFTQEEITQILHDLDDKERFGFVLRAKGIVAAKDGSWIHFDHVPGEADVRSGSAGVIGRLCVIGSKINEEEIAKLFNV